uniref:CRAL-TRIO domain-containing protein n=4 Tax=Oryza TaxID=4527 RepID=A0A0D3FRE5_9ORYZ
MDYCKQQERDGHRDDGDVTEWKKVAELRAVVEAQDPACKFKRYVVYVLDRTCARLGGNGGQEKFAAVADLQGWGYYGNCDIRAYVAALEIMQNYYPERLGRVFLIHVPYVFMAAWKIIYPFIDDNTKKKFVFVADKDLHATLRDAIDDSNLAEDYGGKLKLVSPLINGATESNRRR